MNVRYHFNFENMKILKTILLIALAIFVLIESASPQLLPERQWPSYRGYFSSGVLDNTGLPDTFNPESNLNIRWKISIPGLGLSSPVIWGNRLFITTAVSKSDNAGFKPGIYGDVSPVKDSSEHEWKVICIDKNTGNTLWEKTAYTGIPAMKRHPKSTHANTSMATDGKYAVAFFGSEGLYCYDMDGNLQWKKSFGVLKSVFFTMQDAEWEFASSPVIYDGILIIQCDVLENSFVAAFDVKTGKEIWKTPRNDYPAWCTPNIYKNGGRTYVVLNGYMHIGGYDFVTGKEVWRMSGGGDIPIPTPVIGPDLIYLNSAHGKFSPIIAIQKDAQGDITLNPDQTSNSYVRWSIARGGSYIHSLLLYRNHLYNMNWNGTIVCYDPITGKEIYRDKLGKAKSFIASPVASDGKIYTVDEEGTVYIFQDGDSFKLLQEIPLKDICMTAPALTDGMIIFRTQKYLTAVGSK
jgi:outer membrane protein assembly factor BamB